MMICSIAILKIKGINFKVQIAKLCSGKAHLPIIKATILYTVDSSGMLKITVDQKHIKP